MCLQGQRKTTRDFITTEELTRVDDGFGRAQTAVQWRHHRPKQTHPPSTRSRPRRIFLDIGHISKEADAPRPVSFSEQSIRKLQDI